MLNITETARRPGRHLAWAGVLESARMGVAVAAAASGVSAGWAPWFEWWFGASRTVSDQHIDSWLRADTPPWCPRCGRVSGSESEAMRDRRSGPDGPCNRSCRAIGDRIVVLGRDEQPLSEWVRGLKRRGGQPDLAAGLGRGLGDRLRRVGAVDPDDSTIIVPVPSAPVRRAGRGIDHTRIIAGGVAAAAGGHVIAGVLRHAGGTSQARRNRPDRLTSAAATILAGRRRIPAGAHAVVVDDVRTTGATLRAAVDRVRDAGAGRVTVAVLAARDRLPATERRPGDPIDGVSERPGDCEPVGRPQMAQGAIFARPTFFSD